MRNLFSKALLVLAAMAAGVALAQTATRFAAIRVDGTSDLRGAMLSKLTTVASGSSAAGFNLPAGSAPSSPVNGDLWTTTAGLFARINGATVGPYSAGASGFSPTDPATSLYYFDDFLSFTQTPGGVLAAEMAGNWAPTFSGTSAISFKAGEAGRPGIANIATGTGGTDTVGLILGSAPSTSTVISPVILHASNTLRIDAAIRIPTLPDGTQTFVTAVGLAQRIPFDAAGTNNNRVVATVIWNGSAARWNLETSVNGGATTDTAASTGPTANTWHQVTINATTGTATLLIDGVQVATQSTNIPTGGMAGYFNIQKTAGTTSRSADIDYFLMRQTLATRIQ